MISVFAEEVKDPSKYSLIVVKTTDNFHDFFLLTLKFSPTI